MRLLIDENVASAIADWLADEGHDVLRAAASLRSWDDEPIATRARFDDRVILTNDADFGEMAVRRGIQFTGIIYCRFGQSSAEDALTRVREVWAQLESIVAGHLVVVDRKKIRRRSLVDE